jgi:hypothetical protein
MTPPARSRLNPADTDQPCRIPPHYGVAWPVIWAVAAGLGLLGAGAGWLVARWIGAADLALAHLLFVCLAWCCAWALFAPAVIWLAQHVRVDGRRPWSAALLHLAVSGLAAAAQLAAFTTIRWWTATAAGQSFSWNGAFEAGALDLLPWGVVSYLAIAATGWAVFASRESRAWAQQASRTEAQLVDAELSALQKQLHPHFLFNALNAIAALMHRDVDAADRTLVRLSHLLRLSLEHAGLQEVTLERELEFLSRYLDIEQVRFAERLQVEFDVHPDVLAALVPNFILQPLVENAIKHGVARKRGTGRIAIRAHHEGGKLSMEVQDDGVGLSDEGWTALHKGIGVSTTHARLRRLYGADFRFEFHRRSPGLSVLVAVPFRTGPAALTPGAVQTDPVPGRPLSGVERAAPAEQHS